MKVKRSNRGGTWSICSKKKKMKEKKRKDKPLVFNAYIMVFGFDKLSVIFS
jgi:hypothetical protein